MAVSEQTPYIEYIANGVTTSFALEFECKDKEHLIVTIDGVEPNISDWSLLSGSVVFSFVPSNNLKIIIQRNTPFRRDEDFQSYDNSFRPPGVNNGFDKIWLKLQELGVADWILSNRINDLRAYVDKQDNVLQDNIDSLKNYVDDKDDELRNYLLNAIQEQGVALDQLEEYYSYLMQQLAQVAIDRGWAASFIVSADGSTQQEINDFGGAKWRNKPLGYDIGSTVKLENGDIVKSTVANNIINPNVNMTGWVNESKSQHEAVIKSKRDNETIYDYGAVGDGTLHTIEEWYTVAAVNYRGYANLAAVQVDYPFVTDKDFSCDQAAILKLANLKSQKGGGSVDLSIGVFIVRPISNGPCLPIPTKVTLKGHREDTVLQEITDNSDDPNTSVNWDLVSFTGVDNVGGGIKNCTIRHTGGRRNNTGSITVRGGATRKKINGNIIENTIGSAIAIEYSVSTPIATKCIVEDNYINPTSRHGVYIIGATHNTVRNNNFNISALESVAIRAANDNDILDNDFFGVSGVTAHAITLAAPPAGTGYQYKRLKIKGNRIHNCFGAGFYGQGVGCQLLDSDISENTINQSTDESVTAHSMMLYRTQRCTISNNILSGGRNRGIMLYGCQSNDIYRNTLHNLNEAGNSIGVLFLAEYVDPNDSTTTYSTGNSIKSNKFIDDRGVQKHAHVIQMLTGSNKNNVSKNTYVGGANTKIQSADGLAAQNIGEKTDSFPFTKAAMALGTVAASNMLVGGNSSSVYSSSDAYVKEFRLTIAQVLTSGTVTARLYKNGVAIIANVFNANGVLRTNPLLFQPQQYQINNGDLFTVTIESNGTTSGQTQVDASVSIIFAE